MHETLDGRRCDESLTSRSHSGETRGTMTFRRRPLVGFGVCETRRAISSVGRAFGSHPKGRRFEPCIAQRGGDSRCCPLPFGLWMWGKNLRSRGQEFAARSELPRNSACQAEFPPCIAPKRRERHQSLPFLLGWMWGENPRDQGEEFDACIKLPSCSFADWTRSSRPAHRPKQTGQRTVVPSSFVVGGIRRQSPGSPCRGDPLRTIRP